MLRGRFRKSFEKPEPVTPNEVTQYRFSLRWADHCFRKGHKVMVQVQSSWFPVIDRNPQKYVENIYQAKDADYQPARQRLYRSPKFAWDAWMRATSMMSMPVPRIMLRVLRLKLLV